MVTPVRTTAIPIESIAENASFVGALGDGEATRPLLGLRPARPRHGKPLSVLWLRHAAPQAGARALARTASRGSQPRGAPRLPGGCSEGRRRCRAARRCRVRLPSLGHGIRRAPADVLAGGSDA